MKIFKGLLRLFERYENETSTSTASNRKLYILGLYSLSQLIDVELAIKSTISSDNEDNTITIVDKDGATLFSKPLGIINEAGDVLKKLPTKWILKNQVYKIRYDKDSDCFILIEGNLNGIVTSFKFTKVEQLPEVGKNGVIYLVPNSSSKEEDNFYREFIWLEDESSFEPIGSTVISLDDYYTKSEIDDLLAGKASTTSVESNSLAIEGLQNNKADKSALNALASSIVNTKVVTKEQYDSLTEKEKNTLYIILDN